MHQSQRNSTFSPLLFPGKGCRDRKYDRKHARNQQKIMLILVITQCYQEEMSNDVFPKAEVVAQRCSVKKLFLEIPQISQGNTCARVSFLVKLQV